MNLPNIMVSQPIIPSFGTKQHNAELRPVADKSKLTHVLTRTKMCQLFQQGYCHRGASCRFAHSEKQLKEKPDLSKTYLCLRFKTRRGCKDGQDCKFAHGRQELQKCPDTSSFDGILLSHPAFSRRTQSRTSVKPVGLQVPEKTHDDLQNLASIDQQEHEGLQIIIPFAGCVITVKNSFYHFEDSAPSSTSSRHRSSSAPPTFLPWCQVAFHGVFQSLGIFSEFFCATAFTWIFFDPLVLDASKWLLIIV